MEVKTVETRKYRCGGCGVMIPSYYIWACENCGRKFCDVCIVEHESRCR